MSLASPRERIAAQLADLKMPSVPWLPRSPCATARRLKAGVRSNRQPYVRTLENWEIMSLG